MDGRPKAGHDEWGSARPAWARRGYAKLFHETVLQADEGCDFDFMAERKEG